MRGFVRILEAIISSIILLASMTFFLTPSILETGWDEASIKIQSQDALFTIYKTGLLTNYIKLNDVNSINSKFSDVFSKSVDFSIEVKGIPNPIINIGCNCSDADINTLKTMLSPLDFNYAGRSISIRISNEAINNIKKDTNILFFMGYKNLTVFENKLNQFLAGGGTIFILGDLGHDDVLDGYLNETFGLNWTNGDPVGKGEFYDTENPGNVSYKIAKYFVNITGVSKTVLFQAFNPNHVSIDNRTIVKDQGSKVSFVKINKDVVNGNGRTVWVAGFNPLTDPASKNLTKAMVMWASGEDFKMDAYAKTYPKNYIRTKFLIFDKDSYELILNTWKVFY